MKIVTTELAYLNIAPSFQEFAKKVIDELYIELQVVDNRGNVYNVEYTTPEKRKEIELEYTYNGKGYTLENVARALYIDMTCECAYPIYMNNCIMPEEYLSKKIEKLLLQIDEKGFTFLGTRYKYENLLSTGNSKLNGSFLIFNIPAITTCPYATELCKANCYAMKAQRQYPSVKTQRERNYTLSKMELFPTLMKYAIDYFMKKKKYRESDTVYFRIHESGDFYNQEYFNKWNRLTRYTCMKYPQIKFGAYTKSIGFVPNNDDLAHNFKLTYSVWADTNTYALCEAIEKKYPTFSAGTREEVDAFRVGLNYFECIGDCSRCKACYKREFKRNITIEIH